MSETIFSPGLECQQHCRQWKDRGCVAFVYEDAKSRCTLYNGLNQIEYDEESGGIGYQKGSKIMGIPDGCLPCHRAGWDYGTKFQVLKSLKNLKYSSS